jgi:predicted RNA-binding Zn ribbon-like protein
MAFEHDTVLSLQAAVILVNSAEEPDTLTTPAQLDDFYTGFGYTGRHTGDAAELAAVRELRAPLRELLTADRDGAVVIVNRILAEHGAVPQLLRHDGFDYHVHAVDGDRPLEVRIAVETAMAMIDLIRADEMSRLSVCADRTCAGVVVDFSRNRSRRFCSVACGNRVAAAAYRARKA